MQYSPQERVKFYHWFIECGRSYVAFCKQMCRGLGRHAQVPTRQVVVEQKILNEISQTPLAMIRRVIADFRQSLEVCIQRNNQSVEIY